MDSATVVVRWGWETEEDQRDLERLLRSEGVEARAEYQPPYGNGIGILLAVSVYDVALSAFITGFVGAAGVDAWKQVKRVVLKTKAWYKRRYPRDPPYDQCTLVLNHPASGTGIYISSELPDEAFQKVLELDFEPKTTYVWDDDEREWAGQRDEIAAAPGWRRWFDWLQHRTRRLLRR